MVDQSTTDNTPSAPPITDDSSPSAPPITDDSSPSAPPPDDSNTSDNNIKLYHVSLAYKVDYPFTEHDINFANALDIPSTIYPEELEISLWNCDSVYTQRWVKINPLFQNVYLVDNVDM